MHSMVEREVEGHALQSESEYASKPANGESSGCNSSPKSSVPLIYARTQMTAAQCELSGRAAWRPRTPKA